MKRMLLGFSLVIPVALAAADDARLPPNATYASECGSCHVPYPPQLLPAQSWQQLMGRLDRHFGSDASLDAKAHDEISRYLAANAGRRAAPAGPEPRITETRWFVRKHDDVDGAAWTRPAVKSAANCSACHQGAETGNFSDDEVRIPR